LRAPDECVRIRAVPPPVLIVVTGMPSSGKTTVAETLSRRLRLPLIAKDEIKERLYDTLGTGDVEWSGRLGEAAYKLIFGFARTLLGSGTSTIVEANFFRGQEDEFGALPEHRLVQLHCEAPLDVLLERYSSRTRHPGHHDKEKVKELAARFESGAHSPLDLAGELVLLDTTHPVDEDSVADRVRALL